MVILGFMVMECYCEGNKLVCVSEHMCFLLLFCLHFGVNVMQVFITDLWSEHTPWPFNQIPKSYSFLVKHGPLWRMTYYGTAPRLVHQSNFAATSTFIAR